MWSIIWPTVIIVSLLYIAFVAILFIFQSKFIYFPSRSIDFTPGDVKLPYEGVQFQSEDGVRLAGWFIPSQHDRGTILFCHGNAGNISHRLDSIAIFHRLGMNTFIFDYRGYGQSEGNPTEEGTYRDAKAAWRFLVEKKHMTPERIVVFGRSLGGAIAAWLAREETPGALILESTFTSVRDIASDIYPFLPTRRLVRFNYDVSHYVADADCPVLIVHSRNDDIIPFAHGERLFKSASEPKHFLEMKGSHNDGFLLSGASYVDGLDAFLATYLEGKTKLAEQNRVVSLTAGR